MDSFVSRLGAGSLREKGGQVTVTHSLTEGMSASPPSTHLGPEEAGRWHGGPGLQGQGLNCGGCQMPDVPLQRSFPPLTLTLGPALLDGCHLGPLGFHALLSSHFLSGISLTVSVSVERGAMRLMAAPPWDNACLLSFSAVPRGASFHLSREVEKVVLETPGGGQGLRSSALHLPWLWGPPGLRLGAWWGRVGWVGLGGVGRAASC